MRHNQFIVGWLPEISWDKIPVESVQEFLSVNDDLFAPYADDINKLILLSDVMNLDKAVRARVSASASDDVIFFSPSILPESDIPHFLEHPAQIAPENFPPFIISFFEQYREDEDRERHIEDLYIAYYAFLQSDAVRYFSYYGRISATIRTALAAQRILKLGLSLDEHLTGDPEIVRAILENRSAPDLGLRSYLNEIPLIIDLLDLDPVSLERNLDRLQFEIIGEVGLDEPFGDHVIFNFLAAMFQLDRWKLMSEEGGRRFLDTVING